MKMLKVERSRRGLPVMWEQGGGLSKTGDSQIIAGPHGEALRPLYIKTGGHLACCPHALFVVSKGMFAVTACHHRGDFEITVSRLTGKFAAPDEYGRGEAEAEVVASYKRAEWDGPLAEEAASGFLRDAVGAATEKARCYHCREPHFMA